MEPATIIVVGVIFIATVIRSAFGFGEAMIAVPLLALVIPVEVAVPLAVLVSITVAALIVIQDWREVHFRSALWLVLSSLPGIAIGLIVLAEVEEPVVKKFLGCVIVAFSSYFLIGRLRFELKTDRLAFMFGFLSGVLGGAYGMNGPPLVIYGSLRGWSPQHFRATLQGYFLPASLIGMGGYYVLGLWVPAATHYYLASLPATIAAILLGRIINKRFAAARFHVAVHLGLIVIGLALLF